MTSEFYDDPDDEPPQKQWRTLWPIPAAVALAVLGYGCLRASQRPQFNSRSECFHYMAEDDHSLERLESIYEWCHNPENARQQ